MLSEKQNLECLRRCCVGIFYVFLSHCVQCQWGVVFIATLRQVFFDTAKFIVILVVLKFKRFY